MISTLGCNRVELIEEYDTGLCIPGSLEYPTNIGFGLANVHIEKFWALDGEEVQVARCCYSLGKERLSRARWAV